MDARLVFILAAVGIVHCKLLDSCKIVESFVKGHNDRRQMLLKGELPGQPVASRMSYIIWDDELANKARNWASKNKYGHNPDKTIPSGRFTTGENIYWYATSKKNFNFDPEAPMKEWWAENSHYEFRPLSTKDFTVSKPTGHFTQMAWADTTRVGCAVSQYEADNFDNYFVVCNYGPAGNFLGQSPYKSSGRAASNRRLVCGDSDSDCKKMYGDYC